MTDIKTLQPEDPEWLVEAFALEGLTAIVGSRHEGQVLEFFAEAGHPWVKDDETAWCAAFEHAMLGRAGIKGTGSLAARSYLDWGQEVTKPQRGDVVVFKRGNSAWQGHVAFYLGEDKTHVWVIGGNQSNAVTVARYSKKSLLGYRRPPAPAVTRPARPAAAPAADADLVRAVQEQLLAKGYPEVGEVDGIYGTKTRGAIVAFEADNGLPLTGEPTKALLTEILAAPRRQLSPERTAAPPKVVREKVPEVKANHFAKLWGKVAAIGAAAYTAIMGVVGEVEGAQEALQPLFNLAGDVPAWFYGLAVAGVAFWLYQRAKAGETAGVAAFQSGERR
ncbi:MAG TPA: TIGR02594 family protein [Devosiaceae bacterium]|jgi:uncharacterized protein (TIGR02594 family)|nr:TIGR02594 family protein [Devosiaceae bacterium]